MMNTRQSIACYACAWTMMLLTVVSGDLSFLVLFPIMIWLPAICGDKKQ